MLSLSPDLVYVHEPFNVNQPHKLLSQPFSRWYHYLGSNVNHETISALRRVVDLQYPIRYHLRESQSLTEIKQHVKAAAQYTWNRWCGRSVLWKDPLALLSAEQLAQAFDLKVLVMIRHPAAFAGSLKKKDWTFPFEDLFEQDRLMEEWLADYADQIETFARKEQYIVDQAALLWSILYDVVSQYEERHQSWVFLRHEDVARNPLKRFESLYRTFGLDFTKSIRETIRAYSQPAGDNQNADSHIRRDSELVIHNWKERLTGDEIYRVRELTAPIANRFYTDSDW